MGDGALLEFASVVDSVRFAVLMQHAVAEDNQKIVYRIGINIGDVLTDGDGLFGDGVNIAARLEPLAEPGGICISQSAHNQILGKLDLDFEAMGEHSVKNIAQPIEVWRVAMNDKAALIEPPDLALKPPVKQTETPGNRCTAIRVFALAIPLTLLVAGAYWWQSSTDPPQLITDKPSIAVLPLDNLSNNPEQDYFADGIAADLITGLSKISGLFITARS